MIQEDIQYLTDAVGNKTAVIVPIQEWEQIIAWYKQTDEYRQTEEQMYQAFKEVEAIEAGELEPMSLDDLFDELEVAHED